VVPMRGIGVVVLGRVTPATTINHYQGQHHESCMRSSMADLGRFELC
jgi:hypothetical protein